jgi:hypothetical protein
MARKNKKARHRKAGASLAKQLLSSMAGNP